MSLEGFIMENMAHDKDTLHNFNIIIHQSQGHVLHKYLIVLPSYSNTYSNISQMDNKIYIHQYITDYRVTTCKKIKK